MKPVLKPGSGKAIVAPLWRTLPWLLGVMAAGLALYASAPFGAGIGADGLDYLSTAENLSQGRGFVDFAGQPYQLWPPLYPLILAASARLSGSSVFEAARWFNALSFGLAVALAGALLRRALPERPLWAALAALVVLCMPSFASLGTIVSSDIAFIALCWAFCGRAAPICSAPPGGRCWPWLAWRPWRRCCAGTASH
jgi:4-amino-4-deoxy-L-arabinose transferase-like glycosyltransferase